jgi:hypothetical protein
MYGNHLRESTKKLQDDLRQTMRKYSCEKTNLLIELFRPESHTIFLGGVFGTKFFCGICELIVGSFRIPSFDLFEFSSGIVIFVSKVLDATRHDITRLSTRSNSKKKVHFAEKHSVSEFIGQKDIMVQKNSWSGETKSLPPLSSNDSYSVDSIKAYSALPPIPWRNNDLDPDEVMREFSIYFRFF